MSRRRPPRARRGQCKPVGYGTAAAASEPAAMSGTGRSRYRAAERAGDRRIRVVPRSYFRPCSRKRAGAFFRSGRWDMHYNIIDMADDTAGVAVREPRPGGRAAYLPVLPEPGERTGGYDPPMEREQIRFLLYIVKETNDYEPSLSRPERAAGNVPEVL